VNKLTAFVLGPSLIVPLAVGSARDAAAAPSEVQGVQFTSKTTVVWAPTAGAAGYHVYRGALSLLPAVESCFIGSLQGAGASLPDDPPPGTGYAFLVAAYDETGQGALGSITGGAPRTVAPECRPARRMFVYSSNGTVTGTDGVEDGAEPRRNPIANVWSSRREKTGVYLHTGEFYLAAVDFDVPARGLDLRLTRQYRSQVSYAGPLGFGWDANWNARLRKAGVDMDFLDGSGRHERFGRVPNSSFFQSPIGLYAVLKEELGGGFTLRWPDGTLFRFHSFDGSNLEGALTRIEDRNGNALALLYSNEGLLTTVVDSTGRSATLNYDSFGRITSVTDFALRSWLYGYDPDGNLTSVRTPIISGTPNGNNFLSGRTTSYVYDSGGSSPFLKHNLLQVVAPREGVGGPPIVTNTYDATLASFSFDRVTSQLIGATTGTGVPSGGTLQYTFQHFADNTPADRTTERRRATVVDRSGNSSVHGFNYYGNEIQRTERTNRGVRPTEGDYTTSFEYNTDGEITRTILPMGNEIRATYDSPGADRYRAGNLIEERLVADPVATGGRGDGYGAELNDRVRTFTYDPVFNQLASTVDPRGNDPSYLPQNGGAQSAARYRTSWTFDYQEGDASTNGITAYASSYAINLSGAVFTLGDINGDARTDQAHGNVVRRADPSVTLLAGTHQAGIDTDLVQSIATRWQYNDLGQPTAMLDPEGNRRERTYWPETDPDGNGVPSPAPADGRVLNTSTGGYVATLVRDAPPLPSPPPPVPGRNNGSDPTPAAVRRDYVYTPTGAVTGVVDGRGVRTRYTRNQMDEVVEIRRASATGTLTSPGDTPTGRGEPGLAAPAFLVWIEYDANGNVVRRQDEDRGNTRNVRTCGFGPCVETSQNFDRLDDRVGETRDRTSTLTSTTRYRYDPNQNAVLTILPEGNASSRSFDERDLVFRETRGPAGPPPLALLAAGDPTNYDVRGGAPSTHEYTYDGNRNVTRLLDGRAKPTDYVFDGADRQIRETDPLGNTRGLRYDPAGSLTSVIARGPVGGPPPPNRSGATNTDLSRTRYLYDEMNRRFREDLELFVAAGVTTQRTPVLLEGGLVPGDARINRRFEYDRLSRRTFTVADDQATTKFDYDGAGRRLLRTDPDGSSTRNTWDAEGDLVETLETELSSSVGPPSEAFYLTRDFDALGRRTMEVDSVGETSRWYYDSFDAVVTASDALGPLSGSIFRKTPGPPVSVGTNDDGNVVNHTYDGVGRRLTTTHLVTPNGEGDGNVPPSNVTGQIQLQTVWDGNDLMLMRLDDAGNQTVYTYDNLDRLTRTDADDLTATVQGHDAENNVTQVTTPNGDVLTHTYDDAGHRIQTSVTAHAPTSSIPDYEGTILQTLQYDGLGHLTRATDDNAAGAADDVTVEFDYDSLGRLIEEWQGLGDGSATAYTSHQWTADHETKLIYPDGRYVAYSYDAAGRLSSATHQTAGSATLSYFGMERVHTAQRDNGVRTTMLSDDGSTDIGFDGARRIAKIRHVSGASTLIAGFDYGYDREGHERHEKRLHHLVGPNTRGDLFGYDSSGRLVSFQRGSLNSSSPPALVGMPVDAQSWLLDDVSNWTSMTRNGTTYTSDVNNNNEYDDDQSGGTRVDDGVADDFLNSAVNPSPPNGRNQAHDKAGSRVKDAPSGGPVSEMRYDTFRRLVRTIRAGLDVGKYAYDALGRRVKRTVTNSGANNLVRRYAYASAMDSAELPGDSRVIEEQDVAGVVVRHVVAEPPGIVPSPYLESLFQVRPGSHEHLLTDAAGNVTTVASGATGAALERVVYDAYGKPMFQDAGNADLCNDTTPHACPGGNFLSKSRFGNTQLFRSLEYDPEQGARTGNVNTDWGGLYLAGVRFFDPNQGRHLTRSGAGTWGSRITFGNAYGPAPALEARSGATSGDKGGSPIGLLIQEPPESPFEGVGASPGVADDRSDEPLVLFCGCIWVRDDETCSAPICDEVAMRANNGTSSESACFNRPDVRPSGSWHWICCGTNGPQGLIGGVVIITDDRRDDDATVGK
jgi:YD repeat-containing protein